jgi:hypothetical protein
MQYDAQAQTCTTSNILTRYTNYSPVVDSKPWKAKELQNRSFHSSTQAGVILNSAAAVNSKFSQAVNWCHTSQQIALNAGTLHPEAHVPAS